MRRQSLQRAIEYGFERGVLFILAAAAFMLAVGFLSGLAHAQLTATPNFTITSDMQVTVPWQQISPAPGIVIMRTFYPITITRIIGNVVVPEAGVALVDIGKNGCAASNLLHSGDFNASASPGDQSLTLVASPKLVSGDKVMLCARGFPIDITKTVGSASITISYH